MGHSAMAERLHSTLIIAMWILNVLVPWHTTMEKRKRCASTAPWWIIVDSEKPIGTTDCQESSNIQGLSLNQQATCSFSLTTLRQAVFEPGILSLDEIFFFQEVIIPR